jgi:hypothetical protein
MLKIDFIIIKNPPTHISFVDMIWHWQLNKNSINRVVLVELPDNVQQLTLRDRAGIFFRDTLDPYVLRSLCIFYFEMENEK